MPEKKDSYQTTAVGGNGGLEAGNRELFDLVKAMVAELQRHGSGANTTQALSAEELISIDHGEAAFDGIESRLALASPAVRVTGSTPLSGSKDGGYEVTIAGTNFVPGATVTFGGIPATVVSVESSQIKVVAPKSEHAGPVYVTVITFGGAALRVFSYT